MRNKGLNRIILVFIMIGLFLLALLNQGVADGLFVSVGVLVCFLVVTTCIVIISIRWSRLMKSNSTSSRETQ